MRNIVLQYYWLQNKYFVLLEATRKIIAIIDFPDQLLEKTKLAKNHLSFQGRHNFYIPILGV